MIGDLFGDTGGCSDERPGLGALFCFAEPTVVAAAKSAIVQMNATNTAGGSPAAFAARVQAVNDIQKAYDDATIFYCDQDLVDAGKTAQALAREIAVATHQAPPSPSPLLGGFDFGDILSFLKTAVVVGGVVYLGSKAYKYLAAPSSGINTDDPAQQQAAFDRVYGAEYARWKAEGGE